MDRPSTYTYPLTTPRKKRWFRKQCCAMGGRRADAEGFGCAHLACLRFWVLFLHSLLYGCVGDATRSEIVGHVVKRFALQDEVCSH